MQKNESTNSLFIIYWNHKFGGMKVDKLRFQLILYLFSFASYFTQLLTCVHGALEPPESTPACSSTKGVTKKSERKKIPTQMKVMAKRAGKTVSKALRNVFDVISISGKVALMVTIRSLEFIAKSFVTALAFAVFCILQGGKMIINFVKK